LVDKVLEEKWHVAELEITAPAQFMRTHTTKTA
jgi:hypothetical protein